MEFIMTFGALIAVFVIGFLVGAKQENKRLNPIPYEIPDDVKEQLKKLAGIIEHDKNIGVSELSNIIEGLKSKKDAAAAMFADTIKKCGCGRSETGLCTGLHKIPMKDWDAGIREISTKKVK